MPQFEYISHALKDSLHFKTNLVSQPLPSDIVESVLLNKTCHVDHEGFDLNEIEQEYYKHNNLSLTNDTTWYKDGGQESGANAIIHPWLEQFNVDSLVIDHCHIVFRYPIVGDARKQILRYTETRPELYRLISTRFKCGLDLCIDLFNYDKQIVEPIVHIEWDFDSYIELINNIDYVESVLDDEKWMDVIPSILRYNSLCKKKNVDAFDQANTRSMMVFGEKSYKLIPTL